MAKGYTPAQPRLPSAIRKRERRGSADGRGRTLPRMLARPNHGWPVLYPAPTAKPVRSRKSRLCDIWAVMFIIIWSVKPSGDAVLSAARHSGHAHHFGSQPAVRRLCETLFPAFRVSSAASLVALLYLRRLKAAVTDAKLGWAHVSDEEVGTVVLMLADVWMNDANYSTASYTRFTGISAERLVSLRKLALDHLGTELGVPEDDFAGFKESVDNDLRAFQAERLAFAEALAACEATPAAPAPPGRRDSGCALEPERAGGPWSRRPPAGTGEEASRKPAWSSPTEEPLSDDPGRRSDGHGRQLQAIDHRLRFSGHGQHSSDPQPNVQPLRTGDRTAHSQNGRYPQPGESGLVCCNGRRAATFGGHYQDQAQRRDFFFSRNQREPASLPVAPVFVWVRKEVPAVVALEVGPVHESCERCLFSGHSGALGLGEQPVHDQVDSSGRASLVNARRRRDRPDGLCVGAAGNRTQASFVDTVGPSSQTCPSCGTNPGQLWAPGALAGAFAAAGVPGYLGAHAAARREVRPCQLPDHYLYPHHHQVARDGARPQPAPLSLPWPREPSTPTAGPASGAYRGLAQPWESAQAGGSWPWDPATLHAVPSSF